MTGIGGEREEGIMVEGQGEVRDNGGGTGRGKG